MTKKLVLVVLVATLGAGCASFMSQVGIVMTAQNNCAPLITIETRRGVELKLQYGESGTVGVPSMAFTGSYREIWFLAKAYDASLRYIGSLVWRGSVSIHSGSRTTMWQVDRLDSPQGARCPSERR